MNYFNIIVIFFNYDQINKVVMSKKEEEKEERAQSIIFQEINRINSDTSKIKENGCAACHILFTLINKMYMSEQEASELLSEILTKDSKLNDLFIEMVESVHMKKRMIGILFSIKTRQAKDRYIDMNFKNFLEEISTDLVQYGTDIVLRKLLLSSISLQIAQNIEIDYHAATEELYYYIRKNEQIANQNMIQFIDSFYDKIIRKNM
ncbi:MAG: hypothetical protein ACM31H_02050 [Nitrososphaerales archaeon]